MNVIDFEVKLFDVTSYAADGSNIPRESCLAYLNSSDYTTVIESKIGLGGVTHKDRKLSPQYKGVVGSDDQVLISNNATHYYTGLYFKPGDNFLYASARTFDPGLYSGDRRDNIQNLIGDIMSGVSLPVSVVIRALWDRRGVARKIVRFKGFDFTLNPSFKGAGDIRVLDRVSDDVFSETEDFSDRTFSDTDELVEMERIYSFDASLSQVLGSGSVVSNSSMDSLIDTYGLFSDKVFSNKSVEESRDFSIPVSINERLINQAQPRYTKINRILLGHKNYWNSKSLSDTQKLEIKKLLVTDIRTLLLEVSDEIDQGRTYSSLYALSRFSPELDLLGKKLSNTTRRLHIAYKTMDFYPKGLYNDWKSDTIRFYDALSNYCFDEPLGDSKEIIMKDLKIK